MSISEKFSTSADFDWSDFPSRDNRKKWMPSLKARIVTALNEGKLTEGQIQIRYPDLSLDELEIWKRNFEKNGQPGLRVTRIQNYASLEKHNQYG